MSLCYLNFKKLVFVFLFLCFGMLSACIKAKPPVSSAQTSSFSEIQNIFKEMQSPKREKLSGLAQVKLQVRGRRESFDMALKLMAPDRIELQLMDDLGQVQASLKTDGEELFWQDFSSDRSESFSQKNQTLQKTLGLPLSVEAFISALLQHFSVDETILHIEDLTNAEGKHLLQVDRLSDRIILDSAHKRYQSYSVRKKIRGKHWDYQINYRDYRSLDGHDFPYEMEWNFRKPKLSIVILWIDLELH